MARGHGRSRGTKEWSGTTFPLTTLTTTQAVLASFSHDVTETILRVRGALMVVGIPNAAFDDDVAGFGLIVVTDQALAAGGASIPGPIADPTASWMWHQYVPLTSVAATAASDVGLGLWARIEIDSKAMRKVDRNQTMVLVGELDTGEFNIASVSGGIRILALHG